MAIETRGRPRKHVPGCPDHIDIGKLPSNCYWDNSGHGHWYTTFKDSDGRQRRKKIADRKATLSQLHKALEELSGVEVGCLNWLADKFDKSKQFLQTSKKTQQDWIYCRKIICTYPTLKKGVYIGQVPLSDWNSPLVQKLIDGIADTRGPSAAKHGNTWLKRVFNWGINRGHCLKNPALTIELPKERKLRRLPKKLVVAKLTAFAIERGGWTPRTKGSCPHYVWIALQISYSCRLRGVEIFSSTDAEILEEGFYCRRTKGSHDNITRWNPDLKNAVNSAQRIRKEILAKHNKPIPLLPEKRHLLVNTEGSKINSSSWQSAWRRFLQLAISEGIITEEEWFGLHDMKRRGATDTKGTKSEKLDATGHSSLQMLNIYDMSVPVVDAAGD